jgi:uncharacterized protein (TIGR00369 family)
MPIVQSAFGESDRAERGESMNVEEAMARFERMAFAQFLRVRVAQVSHEGAVLCLPFQEDNANQGGVLHGGATASLIHMAGTLAAWTGLDLHAGPLGNTVDLSVQYVAAALREEITAEALVLRRGRDIFFLDVTVRGAAQQLIGKGLMIYRAPQYTAPMRLYSRPAPPATALAKDSPPVLVPNNQDFTHKLQITTVSHSPGSVRLAMPYLPAHSDEQGNMHPGAVAALLDTAGTYASWSMVQRPGTRGATVGMQLSYPEVSQTDVVAEAHVERRSEEMFFSLGQVRTVSTGHLVAMGNVSYRLLEGR